jgi:hypothetical protein
MKRNVEINYVIYLNSNVNFFPSVVALQYEIVGNL